MTPEVLAMLAGIIAVSYAVQTITGFGSMVVCVTLGANLVSIHELVTLAVPMSLLQTGTIVLKHREDVDWTVLLRRVFPWMGTGLLVALVLLQGLEAAWLKPAFGAMVLVLAARELWRLQTAAEGGPVGASKMASNIAMAGAGIIHGIYATGGPLLVYALGREDLGKAVFRSTLTLVWLVFSVVLIAAFGLEGRYDAEVMTTVLWLVPAVPVGIVAGEWLHDRVEERRFKRLIFGLLMLASLSLLFA